MRTGFKFKNLNTFLFILCLHKDDLTAKQVQPRLTGKISANSLSLSLTHTHTQSNKQL
jgi:hypothetical protein